MIQQTEFRLSAKRRGCHLVTREILENLPRPLPKVGLLNLFVQHTSCALSINENADPDVRYDMEKIMNHIVKENEPYYDHVLEGSDDMPAHAKSSLFGVSITIPITNGHLNLGTWHGKAYTFASSATMEVHAASWQQYTNKKQINNKMNNEKS